MTFLERILEAKRHEVSALAKSQPLAGVRRAALQAPPPRGFARALAGGGVRVIAEVKKASPSRGVLRADFDPVAIARGYETNGAAALSVLTDSQFFGGSVEDLRRIRAAVSVPLLRKDFIVDPYQVWEARDAGADAILLILAAVAGDALLSHLSALAESLDMDVVWEVHDLPEMERVARFAPRVVGINNRDLRTFEVNLETTRALLPRVPAGALVVSESGFSTRAELLEMLSWGVDAFLIGESLMRAGDPGLALAGLLGG